MINHASIFSGIGGFDLAAQLMGWINIFHCENNSFCQKILKHYWPKAASYGDIKKTDFKAHRGLVDVLSGGFPCQPFSNSGRKKGTEDERYLWPEMLRAISVISPQYVVAENVVGIINWNGGVVFEQIHIDLEAQGYEVLTFVLPACGRNAPHRRDRVWFVGKRKASNSNSELLKGGGDSLEHEAPNKYFSELLCEDPWENFPSEYPVCGGNDGFSKKLDGITFSKFRSESIKGYGNAVSPHVVLPIFEVIERLIKNIN